MLATAGSSNSVYATRLSIKSYGNRNHETLAAYTFGRAVVGRPVGETEFEMLLLAVENNATVRYLYMEHGFGDVRQDRVSSSNKSLIRTLAVQQALQESAQLSDPERAALIRFAGAGNCKQQAEMTMVTYGPNIGPDDLLHLVVNPSKTHTFVIHQGGGQRAGINITVDAWVPIGALNTVDVATVDFDPNRPTGLARGTPLRAGGTFIHQTYDRATALRRNAEFDEARKNPSQNQVNAMNRFNELLPGLQEEYSNYPFDLGTMPNKFVVESFAEAVRQGIEAVDNKTNYNRAIDELKKISPNLEQANVQRTLARANNLLISE